MSEVVFYQGEKMLDIFCKICTRRVYPFDVVVQRCVNISKYKEQERERGPHSKDYGTGYIKDYL